MLHNFKQFLDIFRKIFISPTNLNGNIIQYFINLGQHKFNKSSGFSGNMALSNSFIIFLLKFLNLNCIEALFYFSLSTEITLTLFALIVIYFR